MQKIKTNIFSIKKLVKYLENDPEITLNDIYKDFKDDYTIKQFKLRFRSLKSKGYITFDSVQDNYTNIKIVSKKYKTKEDNKELANWKIKLYIDNVYILDELIQDKSIKATDRIKAIDLQQKALKYIEGNYALEYIKIIEDLGGQDNAEY